MENTTATYTDDARIGLVQEILEVIFGLDPEVENRVLSLIKGSIDAQDIKTPEMRQRIGNRAMKYLTNAIELARNEGSELHNQSKEHDLSKTSRGDLEPGHRRDQGMPIKKDDTVSEGQTFKSYLLNELNFDVNVDDKNATSDAIMKIKRAATQGSDRAAVQGIKDARDRIDQARDQDPASPTKQLDIKIANLSSQLAQLQKRRAQIAGQQPQQSPGAM